MRTLLVLPDYPWPATSGTHLRHQVVASALSGLGDLEVFSLVYPRPSPRLQPPAEPAWRLASVAHPRQVFSLGARLSWLASPGVPLELAASVDPEVRAARRCFAGFAASAYDLVWVAKAAVFELLGRPRLGPTVVDLDDLEDRKIASRLGFLGREASAGSLPHRLGAVAQGRLNMARWRRLQRSVAAVVDKVVVCSELDRRRSGLANAAVVPNGYPRPARPLGRPAASGPPRILFVGSCQYMPNADAARLLAERIAPRVRQELPSAQVRLVGEPGPAGRGLHRPPHVVVVGRVASMEAELAAADLVAVPLRWGSGTRVKILEAFAHRIPVVSTSLGAEGIEGAEDGRHLLVADSPEAFASACVRLLGDLALRRRLVQAAEALFLERFEWVRVAEAVRQLALDTVGEPARLG